MDRTEWISFDSDEEWHGLRAKDVTSTDMSALFGMNKYQTEFEVWHRKKGNYIVKIEENDRMVAGRILEPAIAELAAYKLKFEYVPLKQYARLPSIRMGTSFDFLVASGEFEDWILEIKLVDPWVYRKEWTEDEATPYIEIQVQHQLAVSGKPGAIIAALVGSDVKFIFRERNEQVIDKLKERVVDFWKTVDANEEPSPDYVRDSEMIIKMLCKAEAKEVYEMTMYDESLIIKYAKCIEQEKRIAVDKKEARAKFLQRIGTASKATNDMYTVSCGMMKNGNRNFRIHKKDVE